MATCQRCGDYFHKEPHEHWRLLCYDCWISTQGNKWDLKIKVSLPRYLELEERVTELEQRVFELTFCTPPAAVDPDFNKLLEKHLRFLIFAAHPDRNSGSSEASEVTRMLLDLRDKRKAALAGAAAAMG